MCLLLEERSTLIDRASERGISIELDKNLPRAREPRHRGHFRVFVLSCFRDRFRHKKPSPRALSTAIAPLMILAQSDSKS